MANALKHKFVSGKADGPDTTVVRPSNWNDEHTFAGGSPDQYLGWAAAESDKAAFSYITRHFDQLVNNSGGSVAVGDVLVTDPALDNAVTSTVTLQDPRPVRIAAEAINNGVTGRFESVGRVATVNVQGAVARGDFLGCSTTAKKAQSLGATAVDGAFARALSSFGGPGAGSVIAVLFGSTLQVKALGIYGVRGLTVTFNTTSVLDITAHMLELRDNNDRAYVKAAPTSKQVNITTTGPGGRDQSAAFSINSFIRIYAIIKADGTYDVVASVNAPPTGPDLITLAALQQYVGWAYLSTWRVGGTTDLQPGRQQGDWMHYEGAGVTQVVTASNPTTELAVAVSASVPAEALEMELEISALASTASQANALRVRSLTGVDMKNYKTQTSAPGTIHDHLRIPNRNQQFYFLRQTAQVTDMWVTGYRLPING